MTGTVGVARPIGVAGRPDMASTSRVGPRVGMVPRGYQAPAWPAQSA
jgi:hypothetical protein